MAKEATHAKLAARLCEILDDAGVGPENRVAAIFDALRESHPKLPAESSVIGWLEGRRKTDYYALMKLSEIFNVRLGWLSDGTGAKHWVIDPKKNPEAFSIDSHRRRNVATILRAADFLGELQLQTLLDRHAVTRGVGDLDYNFCSDLENEIPIGDALARAIESCLNMQKGSLDKYGAGSASEFIENDGIDLAEFDELTGPDFVHLLEDFSGRLRSALVKPFQAETRPGALAEQFAAQGLKATPGVVGRWLKGQSLPDKAFQVALAIICSVDGLWLSEGGERQMRDGPQEDAAFKPRSTVFFWQNKNVSYLQQTRCHNSTALMAERINDCLRQAGEEPSFRFSKPPTLGPFSEKMYRFMEKAFDLPAGWMDECHAPYRDNFDDGALGGADGDSSALIRSAQGAKIPVLSPATIQAIMGVSGPSLEEVLSSGNVKKFIQYVPSADRNSDYSLIAIEVNDDSMTSGSPHPYSIPAGSTALVRWFYEGYHHLSVGDDALVLIAVRDKDHHFSPAIRHWSGGKYRPLSPVYETYRREEGVVLGVVEQFIRTIPRSRVVG